MQATIRTCAMVVAMMAGSAAMAGPRDTVTVPTMNSDVPNSFGNAAVVTTGTYTAKYIRFTGTLTKVVAGSTFPNEAMIEFFPPAGHRPVFAPAPDQAFGTPTINVDSFLRCPAPINVTPGTINFATFDAYDDGAGADSRWDNLKITLNDGPPTVLVADLGTLAATSLQYTNSVLPGDIKWYRLTLPVGVSSGGGTFLDIDTEGSNVTANNTQTNDTEIVLYSEDGVAVGYDDDEGSGNLSQLTFGAGTRPSVNGSASYDGRDGALPAGTYYLLVRGFGPGLPQVGWDFVNTGSLQSGFIHINIRTNAGTPAYCPADFNKSNLVSVQDVFDFLAAFFGSCP